MKTSGLCLDTREGKDKCEILQLSSSLEDFVGKRKWIDDVNSWARGHSVKTKMV